MIFLFVNTLLAVVMLCQIGRLNRHIRRNIDLRDELLERAREVEMLLGHEKHKEPTKLLVLRGGKEEP